MMVSLKRSLMLLAVLLPCASATAQTVQMTRACAAEIDNAEARIAAARKKPEYRSEIGRQVLSTADRWVNQARRHAAKSEPRNCVSAARKAQEQLAAR